MKTIENVRSLKKALISELSRLPEKNAFGDSNELERLRLQSWILDLSYIENFGRTNDDDGEVSFWFNDECWTPLCDYEDSIEDFAVQEQPLSYAAWLKM